MPEPTPPLPGRVPDDFSWPLYGYTKDHTRFFPAPASLHPPFKRLWVNNAHTLLEFPPVIGGDHIFQLGDNGVLQRDQQAHRAHLLEAQPRPLSASSPAVVGKVVYATVLSRGGGARMGASSP